MFAGEARRLKAALADAGDGQAFLLQGGDCAESFKEFTADNIRDTFRLLLQMAVVLTFAGGKPVVKVGRMAGQFAKPRSSDIETHGRRHPAVLPRRHHQRHGVHARGPHARPGADGVRLHASRPATLNLLRAFATGGYADLHNIHRWTLGFVARSPQGARYRDLADAIDETLGFMAGLRHRPRPAAGARDRVLHLPREPCCCPSRRR